MFKKCLIASSILLASAASANVITTVYVQPVNHGAPNQVGVVTSTHSYMISNDSGIVQDVAVCFTSTLCADNKPYMKTSQKCDHYTLKPGDVKNYTYSLGFNYQFPFAGWCNVDVSTEVWGWQHSVAYGKGKLKIWPIGA